MEEKHVKEVATLEKQCFSSAWSEKALREELQQENAKLLVIEENEKVLAYGGVQIVFGEGFVTNIAVFENQRGKGLGKLITKALIDLCEISISLEVRESNKIAISMYENLEFKKVGERKNFYTNPQENALIYTFVK